MAIPRPNDELRSFSEGAYLAYACTDYPQLWDKQAGRGRTRSDSSTQLSTTCDPSVRTVDDAGVGAVEFFVYDYCIGWPKPTVAEPPFPPAATRTSQCSSSTATSTCAPTSTKRARWPRTSRTRTYLEVPNSGHVTAIYDADRCTSVIARRFIRTLDAGDTSCLNDISEHRVVNRFAETAAGRTASDRREQSRRVTRATAALPTSPWSPWPMSSTAGTPSPATPDRASTADGFGMYTTSGYPFTDRDLVAAAQPPKWVRDIQVTGTGTMQRGTRAAEMALTIRGAGTDKGH